MSKKTSSQSQKVVVIVGPTASGKSDLAVRIASKVDGEIISADSRQVYRGMDIGTGKITKKEMRGIPHYLLDVVSPRAEFNVSYFKKLATKKIEEIVNCGRVPIIVGGTGLWIDALIYDWPIPEVGPNRALRARLEKQSTARLFAKLQKLDPERAKTIDRHNKRRLVRALEIVVATDKPTPEFNVASSYDRIYKRHKIGDREYGVLILGIKLSQQELEEKVYKRLVRRLEGGMIPEIKKLHKSGVSWKKLDDFGLEYRYVSRYLRGRSRKTSSRDRPAYDQMVAELYLAIKNYAKRQTRWFKRNSQINWLESDLNMQVSTKDAAKKLYQRSLKLITKFLDNQN